MRVRYAESLLGSYAFQTSFIQAISVQSASRSRPYRWFSRHGKPSQHSEHDAILAEDINYLSVYGHPFRDQIFNISDVGAKRSIQSRTFPGNILQVIGGAAVASNKLQEGIVLLVFYPYGKESLSLYEIFQMPLFRRQIFL